MAASRDDMDWVARLESQPDEDPGFEWVKSPKSGRWYRVEKTPEYTPEPVAAAPSMPEDDGSGVLLSDYGKSTMAGFAGLGATAGWLVGKAPFMDAIGQQIETLGNDAVDYWNDSLSDSAKAELSKQFVQKNEEGEYEWGDAGLSTVGLMGAQSAPSMLGGMGVGAGLTKVARMFANPIARAGLQKTAEIGAKAAAGSQEAIRGAAALKKLKFVDSLIGAAGFGLGEGVIAGGDAGRQVEQQVRELPIEQLMRSERFQEVYGSATELSEEDRQAYARDVVAKEASSQAGWQSGLTTFLLGGGAGAYYGRLMNKGAAAKIAGYMGKLDQSMAGRALKGAMIESGQEFAQSGAQQYTQNRAMIGAGAEIDPFDDVLEQAVAGAAVGAPLGGGFAGLQGRPDREGGVQPVDPVEQRKAAAREFQGLYQQAKKAGIEPEAVSELVRAYAGQKIDPIAARDRMREILGMPPADAGGGDGGGGSSFDDVLKRAQGMSPDTSERPLLTGPEGSIVQPQQPDADFVVGREGVAQTPEQAGTARLTGPRPKTDFVAGQDGQVRRPGQPQLALPAPQTTGVMAVDSGGVARPQTQGQRGEALARATQFLEQQRVARVERESLGRQEPSPDRPKALESDNPDTEIPSEMSDSAPAESGSATPSPAGGGVEQQPATEPAAEAERDFETIENSLIEERDGASGKGQSGRSKVEKAIYDATAATVIDPTSEKTGAMLDTALKAGRGDLAEYIVARAERHAGSMGVEPGVSKSSPKYAAIKKDLARRKFEATKAARKLRARIAPRPARKPIVTAAPNSERDSALQFLARHPRGLDIDEAIAQGLDPAQLKSRETRVGNGSAFRKNGMSFDEAAELLAQAGYPTTDKDGNYTPNDPLNALDKELRGTKVYSQRNTSWMEREAEEQGKREESDNALRAQVEAENEADLKRQMAGETDTTLEDWESLANATEEPDNAGLDEVVQALSQWESQAEAESEDEVDRIAARERAGEEDSPEAAEDAGGRRPAGDPKAQGAGDLFGQDTRNAQALADEKRRRDAARNSGQDSTETGDPGDLFSQARNQIDLTQADAGDSATPPSQEGGASASAAPVMGKAEFTLRKRLAVLEKLRACVNG